MPRSRPPYPEEYKAELVRLVRDGGRSPSDLAREFEPSAQSIANWVAQADIDDGHRDGLSSDEKGELTRLRQENRVLRTEKAGQDTELLYTDFMLDVIDHIRRAEADLGTPRAPIFIEPMVLAPLPGNQLQIGRFTDRNLVYSPHVYPSGGLTAARVFEAHDSPPRRTRRSHRGRCSRSGTSIPARSAGRSHPERLQHRHRRRSRRPRWRHPLI